MIQDFFARMGEDYFATFSPEEIASHIRMSALLDRKHTLQVRVTQRSSGPGEFEIVIVGFDYLAEFSIFCGLLSAFGLDIRAGNIYSFGSRGAVEEKPLPTEGRRPPLARVARLMPRKVVDVFNVAIKPGVSFDEAKQGEFEQELLHHARLLAAGSLDQARERLHRFLTERIETMNERLSGLLSAVEIDFDNERTPEWTVMSIRAADSFAFLYAISNALAMRGVYIHKVKIGSIGERVEDEFFIADRSGRKIVDPREQDRLHTAVRAIKEFTGYLPEAPDPAKAMRHFDQLLDKLAEEEFPERTLSFLAEREGMNILAHLLGSSDYLWDDFLGVRFAELIPVLTDIANTGLPARDSLQRNLVKTLRAASTFEEKKKVLNRFKDEQVFVIDVQRVLEKANLMEFSQALTDLAEVVVDEAVRVSHDRLAVQRGRPLLEDRRALPFAVCALGKFGGCEMGYASDLELLFVHEGAGNGEFFESVALQVNDFVETRPKGIFHIDLRLRPYGEKGSASTSFDQFIRYYSQGGPAAPFERQALIKLRWIAGNEDLGRRIQAHRDTFTYSGAPWDWENALHLRRRQMKELVKQGTTNVKYSAGGIVEIEYAVQYLQILHGKDNPELRVTGTLEALNQLYRLELVTLAEYELWNTAYLFFRNLIDALRIVRGDATDLVLPEETSEEFKALGRRLGYRGRDRKKEAALLASDVQSWMEKVHDHFIDRFETLHP